MTIEQIGLGVAILGMIGAFCVYQERRDSSNQSKIESAMNGIYAKLDALREMLYTTKSESVTHTTCTKLRESCPCVKEVEDLKQQLKRKRK